MSANVENCTLPVGALLKPTGFVAPEEIKDKTFAEIAGGSGGTVKAYAWSDGTDVTYFSFDKSPADLTEFEATKVIAQGSHGVLSVGDSSTLSATVFSKTSDSKFVLTINSEEKTLTSDSAKDITLW